MSFTYHPRCLCPFLLFLLLASPYNKLASAARDVPSSGKSAVSAVIILGDSTVDPGNNNYIATPFKCNFPPYGRDFEHHVPTGRFCNGRLSTDFIAKYLGVKEYVPPYLDPKLSTEELMTGVSFASAGSGYDPLTPTFSNVIPLSKQLHNLKEYKTKLEKANGKGKTKALINNAFFLISAGTNDFVVNYFNYPIRRIQYSVPAYMDFLLQETRNVLQGLIDQGARRIAVVGLPPMGCLPVVITMYSADPMIKRGCLGNISSIARDYNKILQNELKNMQRRYQTKGIRIAYMDIYKPLEDMTLAHKYGFEEVSNGCCGTGTFEASYFCNPNGEVCKDADKYVFWDSIHPSERAYKILFQVLRPTIDTLVAK